MDPGIAAEALEHIFDRFYRGDPAREGSGTGLGLALVRSIVQLHQGQIRVSSTLGEGSCFHVTLPLVPASSVVSKPRLKNSNPFLILLSSSRLKLCR